MSLASKILLLLIMPFYAIGQTDPYFSMRQQTPVRILFIGNSFTEGNDLPGIVKGLADEVEINTEIVSHIALGQSIDYFINEPECWDYIRSRQWDYIVIQDNQKYYTDSIGTLDSFGMPIPLLSNNIKFQNRIKKLVPCAKIIYFAGWEQNGGDKCMSPNDNTVKLVKRILANYGYLNNQAGVHNIIAPIGIAWISSITQRPYLARNVDSLLYRTDGRHPGNAGSYLAACVLFTTIFHCSPVNLKDIYQFVPQELKTFLQQNAWDAVTDSYEYSNIGSITPLLTHQGKSICASKNYISYQWYNGARPITGAKNFNYKYPEDRKNQEYWVETTDKKGCKYRSFPLKVNPTKN
jgi:hypothetical protein